ncbi:regulatory protein RecX [Photorhabdus laumondii subsp. laumondii]|uniref:Regulatory protein RecX n=2 Tax=Photorhabdus laumondii subsp. laumondii TaxID=141679 RepID=Q7N213_PHOLL|nr:MULTISPECIES: regulatory protein RecX [Photorhabdus]AWK42983.1 RecX family transcriptional regulator [Photorhabdus laumondii subsp. laumondii]AXG43749.1 regulatory protein RecX [Photorhabdus laumondii subsp. laumondii]AXG48299.1 regulatory protein RecX [Photorhabdus laumondii subsp. laumondii]KTL61692.1 RecX family transcriptional regulator [Photorhabdus laumondii subsp. laumondii]MCC8384590.1 regulatory protein RecX [Photorhabdus laumondii]
MTSQELYDHAVSLLARRDYASGELTRALSKMTENRENIDRALSRLGECGYLDDNRLIDKHVRKKHGPARIKQEIRQKGFSQELVEQMLEKVDVDWYAMARDLKVSKFGDAVVSEAKEKNKQIRYLQYKGFSMDMIFEALS